MTQRLLIKKSVLIFNWLKLPDKPNYPQTQSQPFPPSHGTVRKENFCVGFLRNCKF